MPNREDQAQRVFDILKDSRGKHIAELYDCAIWMFREVDHPQKIPVAAYCLREVMNGLGLNPYDNLSDYVKNLQYAWEKGKIGIKKVIDGTCEAKDNDSVVKFLRRCDPIFSKLTNRPTTENQLISVLERDDPSEVPVPTLLRKGTAKNLKDLRNEVSKILHGKNASAEEFSMILNRFEEIILSVHRPRIFDDQKRIDEMIVRIEENAQ